MGPVNTDKAANILALIEAGIGIAKQITDFVHHVKADAIAAGTVTAEDVAAAEQRGHDAAKKLRDHAQAIIDRLDAGG